MLPRGVRMNFPIDPFWARSFPRSRSGIDPTRSAPRAGFHNGLADERKRGLIGQSWFSMPRPTSGSDLLKTGSESSRTILRWPSMSLMALPEPLRRLADLPCGSRSEPNDLLIASGTPRSLGQIGQRRSWLRSLTLAHGFHPGGPPGGHAQDGQRGVRQLPPAAHLPATNA